MTLELKIGSEAVVPPNASRGLAEGLPSFLFSWLITFVLGQKPVPRELSAQQLPAPSDGCAVHQPRAEPKMWSYGCREEKLVLPERCGIRVNTFAASQP